MSEPNTYALELLKNWASRRAVVSLNFEDNSQRRLAVTATVRFDEISPEFPSAPAFIRFSLRPETMGYPAVEVFILRFDGSEVWEEIRDDPGGGIRCEFTRPGRAAFLTLLLVPEGRRDFEPEVVAGEH